MEVKIEEEIQNEKIARKFELMRNDFLVFIIFDLLYFFWATSSFKKFDWSMKINHQIVLSVLFYNLVYLKIIISSFVFNVKNNSRYLFFFPLFLFQSGSFFGWIFHFFKSVIWFWKNSEDKDNKLMQRMKWVSNLLFFLVIILFIILIAINSIKIF